MIIFLNSKTSLADAYYNSNNNGIGVYVNLNQTQKRTQYNLSKNFVSLNGARGSHNVSNSRNGTEQDNRSSLCFIPHIIYLSLYLGVYSNSTGTYTSVCVLHIIGTAVTIIERDDDNDDVVLLKFHVLYSYTHVGITLYGKPEKLFKLCYTLLMRKICKRSFAQSTDAC